MEARISKREAAEILGVTRQSVSNLTARGALSVERVGKWNYYNLREVEALVPKCEGIRDAERAIAEVESELERTRSEKVSEVMMHRARREFIERMTDTATFARYQELVASTFDAIEASGVFDERTTTRERDILDQILHLRPLGEIARYYGLTENRVKQIFEKALRKMVYFSSEIGGKFAPMRDELVKTIARCEELEAENKLLRAAAKNKEGEVARPLILDINIKELYAGELLPRTANCLRAAGCETVKDILKFSRRELMRIRNFGKRSMIDLDAFLTKYGLELGMAVALNDERNETV